MEADDYIRTKHGDISKITLIDEDSIFLDKGVWSERDPHEKTGILYKDDEEIKKASPNIVELIEERRLCKWL